METIAYFEQRLSAQILSATILETEPEEQVPPRRLRSCKRRALVEHQVCESPNHYSDPLPAQKRLRRTQAYSDLECSSRQRNSPIIPISVQQRYWLEDAVIKARKIIHDKENAEAVLQRVAGAASVESLGTPWSSKHDDSQQRPRVSLHHKNKTENLRSKYSSPASSGARRPSSESLHRKDKSEDLRSKYSSSTPITAERATPDPLHSLDKSRPSTSTKSISAGSLEASTTPESPEDKQQGYLYCVCQEAFEPALGEMVACDICDGWFHLRCVGQEQHDAASFEHRSFYCPRCEAFAYQEIVSEEKEGAEDL